MIRFPLFPAKFARKEDGAVSVMNLYFVVILAIFAGLAIDMASLIRAKTQLQIAADTAAHAALYTLHQTRDVDTAKQTALKIASEVMPQDDFGAVLRVENIHFGTYDKEKREFYIDDTQDDAVYVETDQLAANQNPVSSYLLDFIGFDQFDVVTASVFETYRPTCLREGFVAENVVDIQSNNGFFNGFCIHSNTYVAANQNNLFEAGTIVSMPDTGDLELPSSGFEQNEGLKAALREGRIRLRIISRLIEIEKGLTDSDSDYYRDYLTSVTSYMNPLPDNNNNVTTADVKTGRVNELYCDKTNGTLTFAGETFKEVVIITDCEVKMSSGTAFEDSLVLVKNKSSSSISAPSGLRLGKDDGCKDGGGAQLITYGGISNAAKVEMYGSQIIAAGDVAFAAANEGVEGASIVAAGRIDVTSGSSMAFCGSGMDSIFEAEYFRLAG